MYNTATVYVPYQISSMYGGFVSGFYLPQYTLYYLSKRKTSADMLLYYL